MGVTKTKDLQQELAMEARDARRQSQRLQACQVALEIFAQVLPRVHTCMKPFVASWRGHALPQHAETSARGRLSDVERTNVASIADHFGQDRLGLQGCIGWTDGDDARLRQA